MIAHCVLGLSMLYFSTLNHQRGEETSRIESGWYPGEK